MLPHKGRDPLASNLLFSFQNHSDVHGENPPASAHQRIKRFNVHPHLTLVVYGSTRIDVAVANLRLEGQRKPLV